MTTLASRTSQVPHGVDPIKSLSELSVDDIASAGGKGTNLGQLTWAGLPVPPGRMLLGHARA